MGQIETDEIYMGIDQRGAHHFFPLQAKGQVDRIGLVQIYQDFGMCEYKYPALSGHPVAAQLLESSEIALFTFVKEGRRIRIAREKHYHLVPPEDISPEDLRRYREDMIDPL
jgi:hypothetical protein